MARMAKKTYDELSACEVCGMLYASSLNPVDADGMITCLLCGLLSKLEPDFHASLRAQRGLPEEKR